MKRKLWIGVGAVAALAAGGLLLMWWGNQRRLKPLAPLEGADTYVLLSLEPDHSPGVATRMAAAPSGEYFHYCKVLGRVEIKDDPTRRKLNEALIQGVRQSDGTVAACFEPRHGIIVTRGGVVTEYAICFHCLSMEISQGDKSSSLTLTSSPNRSLTKYLPTPA